MSLYSSKGKFSGNPQKKPSGRRSAENPVERPRQPVRTGYGEEGIKTEENRIPRQRSVQPGMRQNVQNPADRRRVSPQQPDSAQAPYQRPAGGGEAVNHQRPYSGQRAPAGGPGRSPQPPRRRKRRNGLALTILIVLLILTSVICGSILAFKMYIDHWEDQQFKEIAEQVHSIETQDPAILADSMESYPPVEIPPALEGRYSNFIAGNNFIGQRPMLPQYKSLYEQNPQVFGWLKIDGTRIDYPVMQSPEDPQKYLHQDYMGRDNFAGTPFLDANAYSDSDQLLIYGHNMLNGSMFRDLLKYQQSNFYEEHPIIHFDTLFDSYDFEVMAAFYDKVYMKTDDCFKFYQFIDASTEEEYNEAVNYYKEHSLYDTGVGAQLGDQLLALVTCSYQTEDGRFVVVARKINDAE